MSNCDPCLLDPSCPVEPPKIVTGEDRFLPMTARNPDGSRVNLSTASEIIAELKNADGSILSLALTNSEIAIISAIDGTFQVIISVAQSALLKLSVQATSSTPAVYSDMVLKFTISGKLSITNLPQSINVVKPLL